MADIEFSQDVGEDHSDPSVGGGLNKLAQLAGAAVSLALLVGVGVWGYKLMVRDVTGIPVVRALEGPMRVQPENPGGRLADHQGLAVNAVAADGSAADPADMLILAPRPVDLADEDAPASELVRPAARPVSAVPGVEVAPEPTQVAAAPNQAAEIEALVAQITQGVASAEVEEDAPSDAAVVDTAVEVETAALADPPVARDVPGVTVSLRPQQRPAGSRASSQTTATVTPASAAPLDIDPADVPSGTRVVQLGAYESAEMAQSEWDRIAGQFGDYMQDKRRIVQEASSGGRTFFRLRVHGFEDLSDARRFCSALVAEGADCIPVVTR